MDKTAMSKDDIDYVIAGTVIQEVRTSNIAREAAINAGLPNQIGAHTIAMVGYMRYELLERGAKTHIHLVFSL